MRLGSFLDLVDDPEAQTLGPQVRVLVSASAKVGVGVASVGVDDPNQCTQASSSSLHSLLSIFGGGACLEEDGLDNGISVLAGTPMASLRGGK